ncbi:UNVERIFIED_CONTAM: hypothetical protein Slati_4268500 [Sesamum latifolium]|uniref:Uncharacterized protein n=1 Tax=Sesamum latifolium TaxID=2727402 RepID=A0AAW2TFD7_9LAMI
MQATQEHRLCGTQSYTLQKIASPSAHHLMGHRFSKGHHERGGVWDQQQVIAVGAFPLPCGTYLVHGASAQLFSSRLLQRKSLHTQNRRLVIPLH